jgi:hypothetical protein
LLLSPLGEGQSPSFEQFRIPSPQGLFVPSWLKLAQWFWRRSRKCKSLQTAGQRVIRIAHLSFQLRWAKNYNSGVALSYFWLSRVCIEFNFVLSLSKNLKSYSNFTLIYAIRYIQNYSITLTKQFVDIFHTSSIGITYCRITRKGVHAYKNTIIFKS